MVRKNHILILSLLIFLAVASCIVWLKPMDDFSDSERRTLKQFPEVSLKEVISGDFMSDFESYVTDQFPARDRFRKLKSFFSSKILGQKDVHDIYIVDEYASKIEYPLNEDNVERAVWRFRYVYDKYMKDADISTYYAIIPDKNYFLAEANGYLSMNYEQLFEIVRNGLNGMKEIVIADLLSIEDYYKTDSHWRQEQILDVSNRILEVMGNNASVEYDLQTLDVPFYGVYAGQSGTAMDSESILYYTNCMLENCTVYDYEMNQTGKIYDMDKGRGKDPYEMFLSGPKSLLTIENPNGVSDKELIIFRDSFGSSIAPLLIESYAKMTLVDIRYIHPDILGKYINFENQDVLFLYSTSVLNNGDTIK